MNEKKIERDKKLLWEMQHYERLARAQGFQLIAGVDEAGRGPLAGPVVAAACILDPRLELLGINDSKKLTPAKRTRLYQLITENAIAWKTARTDHVAIDKYNILQATKSAMCQAIESLLPVPDLLLIDAVDLNVGDLMSWPLVRGDNHSVSIAAASILAKVTRDRLMEEYDAVYPGYGFAQHKGYGTAAHYDALFRLGPCPIHRRTFLRSVADKLVSKGLIEAEYFSEVE